MYKFRYQYKHFVVFVCLLLLLGLLYQHTWNFLEPKIHRQDNYTLVEDKRAITMTNFLHSTEEPKDSYFQSVVEEKYRSLTENELKNMYMNNCNANPKNLLVQLNCCKDTFLPVTQYKQQLASNFTKTYCNPATKSAKLGILTSYKGKIPPNPASRLHFPYERVDIGEIEKSILQRKVERLSKGDDDPLKIPEVEEELRSTTFKIPNLVHFVWFGKERRFRVEHYMAIVGALRYQRPKLILVHCDASPVGEYWEVVKHLFDSKLKMVKRTPPANVFNRKINVVEHKSDVARLEILMEIGGIYLDTDSLILKSVDPLRNYEMVQAESDFAVLANGIMLANRNSWFLRRWYHEYKYFQDYQWGHHSVLVPWSLWKYFPDKIHVTQEQMCRPSWSELHLMFRAIIDWKPIYIMHLYTRAMKYQDGIAERPLKQLAVLNTTYGEVARHVIWGNKAIRDVTDWIVTCNLTKALTMGSSVLES